MKELTLAFASPHTIGFETNHLVSTNMKAWLRNSKCFTMKMKLLITVLIQSPFCALMEVGWEVRLRTRTQLQIDNFCNVDSNCYLSVPFFVVDCLLPWHSSITMPMSTVHTWLSHQATVQSKWSKQSKKGAKTKVASSISLTSSLGRPLEVSWALW